MNSRRQEHGFAFERTEYPEVPPKTEHSLTAFGKTLEPIMAAMASWGTEHRERFDE